MTKLTPDMFKPWKAYEVAFIDDIDSVTSGLMVGDRMQPIEFDETGNKLTFNLLNRRRHVIMPLEFFQKLIDTGAVVNNPDDTSKLMGYALLNELHVGQKFIVKSELSLERDGKITTFSEGNVFIIVEKGDPLKFSVEKLGEPPIAMPVANFIELGRNGSIDELMERDIRPGSDLDGDDADIPELKLSGKKVRLRTSYQIRANIELERVAAQCHGEDLIRFCKRTLKEHGVTSLDD